MRYKVDIIGKIKAPMSWHNKGLEYSIINALSLLDNVTVLR